MKLLLLTKGRNNLFFLETIWEYRLKVIYKVYKRNINQKGVPFFLQNSQNVCLNFKSHEKSKKIYIKEYRTPPLFVILYESKTKASPIELQHTLYTCIDLGPNTVNSVPLSV